MSTTYNIYKLPPPNLEPLKEKMDSVGLKEQKTKVVSDYTITFYFSENVAENLIWWWKAYEEYFNDGIAEPKNKFYFALLIGVSQIKPENIYVISLGKSHFYLNKFILKDFGINFATRIGDEKTTLLKKSRYFAGSKRNDIASYTNFVPNNYEPGESVDHIKIKAADENEWGKKNIILADSIQIDSERRIEDIAELFDKIESALAGEELIQLPKLEEVKDASIIKSLDEELLELIKNDNAEIVLEEFTSYGTHINFRSEIYDCTIFTRVGNGPMENRHDLGGSIAIDQISEYLTKNSAIDDINTVKIKFRSEFDFTKDLKELIDCRLKDHYLLKNGDWYYFNQRFIDYLKYSIESIEHEQMDDLDEEKYLEWKEEKEKIIVEAEAEAAAGNDVEFDMLTYREFYFNEMQSLTNGYVLLDRITVKVESILKGGESTL
ncbi:DUF6119 family protein [Aquitalea aquatilis]|uniref:DUF6119 family protein n=1 Tax=Aquitalea aquatilis TaxID=1537400 RepID=UPI00143D01CC|nr:DUF6119 family protein [Aquitalea aquatilis]